MKGMKLFFILFLFVLSCKNKHDNKGNDVNKDEVTLKLPIEVSAEKKSIEGSAVNNSFEYDFIHNKEFKDANKKTELNFYYPVFSEEINIKYKSYNDYVKEYIIDNHIELMRADEPFITVCDSLPTSKQIRDIYYIIRDSKEVISTLFVIESSFSDINYSVTKHTTVNYDLSKNIIVMYDGLFKDKSEKDIFNLVNKEIRLNSGEGSIYNDCWELSFEDFKLFKNNFVIDNDTIRFYFDSCIFCPPYKNITYVELETKDLKTFFKPQYNFSN